MGLGAGGELDVDVVGWFEMELEGFGGDGGHVLAPTGVHIAEVYKSRAFT